VRKSEFKLDAEYTGGIGTTGSSQTRDSAVPGGPGPASYIRTIASAFVSIKGISACSSPDSQRPLTTETQPGRLPSCD
jgi:hypothetical protein